MARTPAALTASDASNASWVHPDVVNDASFFLRQNMHRTFLSGTSSEFFFHALERIKSHLSYFVLLIETTQLVRRRSCRI